MDIRLTFSVVGYSGTVRVLYYETSAPSAVVATHDFTAGVSVQVDQYVDNAVPHIVKAYRYVGGVLGALMFDFIYDPSYASTAVQTDIYFTVDGGGEYDPATGATSLTHPVLFDYNVHHVFRDSALFHDWSQDLVTGTISMTDPDDAFNVDELITVSFYPKISTATPVNVVNSLIAGFIAVDDDYTVLIGDAGKFHAIDSANSTVTVTLPAISTIPNNKVFLFQSTAGSQKIVKLALNVADTNKIKFNGDLLSWIYLTMGEEVWLVKNTNHLYAVNTNIDYNEVGTVQYVHIVSDNQLLCDGSEISRLQYARLWEKVQGIAITQATKNTTATVDGITSVAGYKGCYGDGDGLTTFTLPNCMNDFIRGLKTNGGSDSERAQNIPGGFQTHKLQDHIHRYPIAPNGGSAGTSVYGRGGTPAYDNAGKTESPKKTDVSAASVGIETRGQNIGLFPVVKY